MIVENRDVGWNGRPRWTVDSAPRVTIGMEEGPDVYRFSGVAGVVHLPNGELAVADRSNSIRIYNAKGVYRLTVGREGAGPGEFGVISVLRRLGNDSLIVWDFALRRITMLSVEGRVGRTVNGPSLAGFFFGVDFFPDGSLLGVYAPPFDLRHESPGRLTLPLAVLRYDIHTLGTDTLGEVRGATSYVEGGTHPAVISVPFSPEPVALAVDSLVYAGSGYSYEIRTYTVTGELRRILRLARPNPALTHEVIRRYVDRLTRRARGDAARRQIEEQSAKTPYPETLPAYDEIVADSAGELWVSRYPTAAGQANLWTIFDPAGRLIGDVSTPPGFSVFEVGSDYLLGVARDSLDVERVELLGLSKRR